MTTSHDLERSLGAWMHAHADEGMPDYLDEIVDRVARERQRAWWSSRERWLPMDTTFSARLAPSFRPAWLLILAAILLLGLVGAVLLVGSQPRLPAPFGPARTGTIAVEQDFDIVAIDATTRVRKELIGGPERDSAPRFSPDGTKLAFLREDSRHRHVVMVATADGTDVRQVSQPLIPLLGRPGTVAWSGDGRQIAVTTDGDGISIVNIDGGATRPLDLKKAAEFISWLPPAGGEIVFRSQLTSSLYGIWAGRPDGTGFRPLTQMDGVDGSTYQNPIVSHDGRLLAYNSWVNLTEHRLHIRNLVEGTTEILQTPEPYADHYPISFSPDGRWLLMAQTIRETPCCPADGVGQLVLVPVDDLESARPIGPTIGVRHVEGDPTLSGAFSPDSKFVFELQGTANGQGQTLWTIPIDGSPGFSEPWPGSDLPTIQRVAP
jgi:hypothetical protein